jgi:uncharacterized membrane protein
MSRLSEAHSRSLAKAVTWRFTATIDTFLISLIVTGKIAIAGTIAGAEIGTKILIYYFHERAWSLIPWGRRQRRSAGSFATFAAIRRASSLVSNLAADCRPGSSSKDVGELLAGAVPHDKARRAAESSEKTLNHSRRNGGILQTGMGLSVYRHCEPGGRPLA